MQLRYSAATAKTFWKERPWNEWMYVYTRDIRVYKTSTTSRPSLRGRAVAFSMNPFVFGALRTVNGGFNTVTHRLEKQNRHKVLMFFFKELALKIKSCVCGDKQENLPFSGVLTYSWASLAPAFHYLDHLPGLRPSLPFVSK